MWPQVWRRLRTPDLKYTIPAFFHILSKAPFTIIPSFNVSEGTQVLAGIGLAIPAL
jgi:hypothetical protein